MISKNEEFSKIQYSTNNITNQKLKQESNPKNEVFCPIHNKRILNIKRNLTMENLSKNASHVDDLTDGH